MTEFKTGDRVEPLPDEVMRLQGEQTVIATYSHPVTGEWLWLATEDGIVRSFSALWWRHAADD